MKKSYKIIGYFTNTVTGSVKHVNESKTAVSFAKAISNSRFINMGKTPCVFTDLGSYEILPKEVEREIHSSRKLTWEEKYQNLLEEDEVSDQELADLDDLLK